MSVANSKMPPVATLRAKQRYPVRAGHGLADWYRLASSYRHNTNATAGTSAARTSISHPRRSPELPRVNRNDMPTAPKQAVPRLVQAMKDGGRPLTRKPPAIQNRLNAPATPASTSHVCRRSSSRRVGARVSPMEAKIRLFRSAGAMRLLLLDAGKRSARRPSRLGLIAHGGPQGRGAPEYRHLHGRERNAQIIGRGGHRKPFHPY